MGKEESVQTKVALIQKDISNISQSIKDINETLKTDFVRKDAFEPVRLIAYGLAGVLLVTIITAIAGTVIVHPWTSTISTTTAVPLK